MRRHLLLALLLTCLSAPPAVSQGRTFLPEPRLPAEPYRYALDLPPHLASLRGFEPAGLPPDNDALATLGRVLFHDRTLSRNGLVSCASCHTQAFGFDDRSRLSIGFEGRVTRRAAMTLVNARFSPSGRYFRDERAASLEQQVLEPFTDPIEMGLASGELAIRTAVRPFYPALFEAAFGDGAIGDQRMAAALAAYVRAIVPVDSRYDRERAKTVNALEPFAGFTAEENRGKALFMTGRDQGGAGCAACHEGEGFVMRAARSNGLTPGRAPDDGLGEITGRSEDDGLFRAGSLRNIAVTAPYMHDGRFASLEEVVEHYDGGVFGSPNLDALLRDGEGKPARLGLSPQDKAALVAFLKTLTDETLMTDDRFSDPFLPR